MDISIFRGKNLFEIGPLTQERFRELLRALSEDSMFNSIPFMWWKKPLFKLLVEWSHHNKGMCLQVLFEEIDSCSWQAVDLIERLIDRKHYIVQETNPHPNRYHAKILRLYRFAIGRGYGTPNVRAAYDELRAKLKKEKRAKAKKRNR